MSKILGFRYAGGKSKVADFLVRLLPPHKLYVDMFCGGLSVSLAKRPSEMEWFNDKYNLLINLFWVIQQYPNEFVQWFQDNWVLDSEYIYRTWLRGLKEKPFIEEPDVEAAAKFWMVMYQTFSGKCDGAVGGGSFSVTLNNLRHVDSLPIERIMALHRRLSHAIILCRDFRDVFDMIIGRDIEKTAFIFEDPPYWDVRGGSDYTHKFSWQDHLDLRDLNLKTRARWLMTINNHQDVMGLYDGLEGIYFREYDIKYSVVANRGSVTDEKELLISNYDTYEALGPLFSWRETQDEEVE